MIYCSVRDAVDSDGNHRIHRRFDAFGNIVAETHYDESGDPVTEGQAGFVDTAFAFTARYLDRTTGLQNNLHRWYDSHTGRWLSEDPIGFRAGDANIYRYVGNQPTIYIDPNGALGLPVIGSHPRFTLIIPGLGGVPPLIIRPDDIADWIYPPPREVEIEVQPGVEWRPGISYPPPFGSTVEWGAIDPGKWNQWQDPLRPPLPGTFAKPGEPGTAGFLGRDERREAEHKEALDKAVYERDRTDLNGYINMLYKEGGLNEINKLIDEVQRLRNIEADKQRKLFRKLEQILRNED